MQSALIGFGLTMHSISGNGLRSRARTKEEVEESFTNYASVEGKSHEEIKTIMESMWRQSLLTLFHFKVDALFQNLLTSFGTTPGKTGFGRNCDDLLGRITLNNRARAKETLNVITFLRNSLHNNGIHRGSDHGPFAAHGLTYLFKKDAPVQCASIAHVLAILDSTIDVLEEILVSAEVKSLPNVVDQYANLIP